MIGDLDVSCRSGFSYESLKLLCSICQLDSDTRSNSGKKKKAALKVFFNGVFEFVTSWKVDDVHQLFVQQTLSVFYDAATGV